MSNAATKIASSFAALVKISRRLSFLKDCDWKGWTRLYGSEGDCDRDQVDRMVASAAGSPIRTYVLGGRERNYGKMLLKDQYAAQKPLIRWSDLTWIRSRVLARQLRGGFHVRRVCRDRTALHTSHRMAHRLTRDARPKHGAKRPGARGPPRSAAHLVHAGFHFRAKPSFTFRALKAMSVGSYRTESAWSAAPMKSSPPNEMNWVRFPFAQIQRSASAQTDERARVPDRAYCGTVHRADASAEHVCGGPIYGGHGVRRRRDRAE